MTNPLVTAALTADCIEELLDGEGGAADVAFGPLITDGHEATLAIVEVSGNWTQHERRTFSGTTRLLALQQAVAARRRCRGLANHPMLGEAERALRKLQRQAGQVIEPTSKVG